MIRFRPLIGLTLCFVPALAMLVGLGLWQLQRLEQKQALIAAVAAGLAAEPVPLADALKDGVAQAQWRRVRVAGRFLHDKELYVFARAPMDAVGVEIVTPLVQDNGETVLVDRGFVPAALRDPKTREAGQIPGDIVMTGTLRLSQAPGLFTPEPDAAARLWFARDVPAMAAAMGVTAPPVLVEADATPNPGGWPLGGRTQVEIPNDHLQYAITWFGLALALLAVYLLYHRSQGRLSVG